MGISKRKPCLFPVAESLLGNGMNKRKKVTKNQIKKT